MKFQAIIFSSISLVSCGLSPEAGRSDPRCAPYENAGVPCELPMVAVLANPKEYELIPISVGGFLAGETLPGTIYLSREAWVIGDGSSSILLSSADENISDNSLKYKFSYVVVSGILNSPGQRKSRQPNLVLLVDKIVHMHKPDDFSPQELRLIEDRRDARVMPIKRANAIKPTP